jgi:RHS repeat-associated protein
LDGEIVQHVEYVPFGEVFIEERNNVWNTPYLFNAKELDEETGLYYYGARYYDARTSVWLSTDPLQEKYPNVSTYVYCVQNPVKFVDPDGEEPDRNKAGTIEQAINQWKTNIDGDIRINSIYNYVMNNADAIRFVYTEDKGWIDLQHFFGTYENTKIGMDLLEPLSGMDLLRSVGVFNENSNKSYYSYEDLPTNQFASDSKKNLCGRSGVFKYNEPLLESIEQVFTDVGATMPTNAPNWKQMPFNDHERDRLPEKQTSVVVQSTIGAFVQTYSSPDYSLLKTGNYVPQNRTSKPYDLTNFAPAPSSIEKGDTRKSVVGW